MLEDAEIDSGRAFRCAAQRALIHEDDAGNLLVPREFFERACGVLAGETFGAEEVFVEDAVNEGAFAAAADSGDAGEDAERNFNVELLQVVLAGPGEFEPRSGPAALVRDGNGFGAGEVGGG